MRSAVAGDPVEDVLDALDAGIARHAELAESHATDWTRAERVATAYRARFRISADVHDLLAARQWVDEAFRRAPNGSGPWLTKAGVHASLHELDEAQRAYERAAKGLLMSSAQKAAIHRGQAEVTLMQGDVAAARRHLEAAGALDSGFLQLCARAHFAEKTEGLAAAAAHFAAAAALPQPATGEGAAWLWIQRARLAHRLGAHAEAQAHLDAAEAALPGWYATAALAGELQLAAGDSGGALDALERAVDGTEHPEYLARMAMVLAETDVLTAAELFETADTRMKGWLADAPSAMAAHAAQLALAQGDSKTALSLAEQHARTHADVDALVLLSRAQRRAGQLDAARTTLQRAHAGGWLKSEIEWLCAGGCPD